MRLLRWVAEYRLEIAVVFLVPILTILLALSLDCP